MINRNLDVQGGVGTVGGGSWTDDGAARVGECGIKIRLRSRFASLLQRPGATVSLARTRR